MEYEPVIGLEVHAQLLTRSKMFCSCRADYQAAPPNTLVCPVCLGMPGTLPVINRQAVEYTIMTGLALNCTIAEVTKFDRKNYPYPDLMKGYQISQYDMPIAKGGWLEIEADGQRRKVGITRVHLEEDVAKLLHRADPSGETYSLVDVNRSGVPLMEIVGEPDLRSPEEARQYLIKLHAILQYLGVSTGNMEEGSFRCDANVSIRPKGSKELFSKVEVKNMNSFRAVYRALGYEVPRQISVVEGGGRVAQETRGWVEEKGQTVSQRSKEYAHDYRYFPEPDLPPLVVSREWVEGVRRCLPELPDQRRDRFTSQYGLPLYDASLLTASKAMGDFYEAAVRPLWEISPDVHILPEKRMPSLLQVSFKAISNWMLGEMTRLLNAAGIEIDQCKVIPEHLIELQGLVDSGTISTTLAKAVLEEVFQTGKSPKEIVLQRGYTQVSDVSSLAALADQAITSNPQAVSDYLKGKETALRFLVGQVMKASQGKANPNLVSEDLKERLQVLRASHK